MVSDKKALLCLPIKVTGVRSSHVCANIQPVLQRKPGLFPASTEALLCCPLHGSLRHVTALLHPPTNISKCLLPGSLQTQGQGAWHRHAAGSPVRGLGNAQASACSLAGARPLREHGLTAGPPVSSSQLLIETCLASPSFSLFQIGSASVRKISVCVAILFFFQKM